MRKALGALTAVIAVGATLTGGAAAAKLLQPDRPAPQQSTAAALPPCPTEDSVGCFWDATVRGNGEGKGMGWSFTVDRNGRVTRSTGRFPDCEDLDGWQRPCVTYDEREWRLVTSIDPYEYRVVHLVTDAGYGFVVK